MKSKPTNQRLSINLSKVIRGALIASLVAAICVISAPAKSSFAVSWGGCGSGCAGTSPRP